MMKRREPFQFMLTLAMFGSGLVFLFLLIVYSARKNISAQGFEELPLPEIFYASTIIIIISSFTLHIANINFRKDHFITYRILMGLTLILGISFIFMQLWGWQEVYSLSDNPARKNSGGFIYLLSGLHILHIIIGIFFLVQIFIEALKRMSYVESFVYSVNPPNQLKINLIIFYWHFVDVLWVILFLYLLWQHS